MSLKRFLFDLLIFSAVPLLALLISSPIFYSDDGEDVVEGTQLVTQINDHQHEAKIP